MNIELVKNKIEKVGHRVKFNKTNSDRLPFNLNVERDKNGEYFTINLNENVKPSVLDTDGDHLLLMFKVPSNLNRSDDKFKALIGHDEIRRRRDDMQICR